MNVGFKGTYVVSSYSNDHINPPLVARLKEADEEGKRLVKEGHAEKFVTYPFVDETKDQVDIILLTDKDAEPVIKAEKTLKDYEKIPSDFIEKMSKPCLYMGQAVVDMYKDFIEKAKKDLENAREMGYLFAKTSDDKLPEPKRNPDDIPGLIGRGLVRTGASVQ